VAGSGRRLRFVFCVAPALLAAVLSFAAAESLADDSEWPSYNHRLSGVRYSDLAQINVDNVSRLEEVCRLELAPMGSLSAGPILVDGRLYVTTDDMTLAINARDCSLLWRAQYLAEQAEVLPKNRGVAYWAGRLYRGTGDGRLVSYDARTGREVWRKKIGDPLVGEFASAAPVAWKGMVFTGVSGGELGVRGRMMAFDAASGRKLWTFDLIPGPGQTGAGTWAGDSWKHGGGATWSSYAVDEKSGELFVSVDNPAPAFNGKSRAGDNLFTDSVVVLDAKSGRLLWYVQLLKHDRRDYGASAPAVLMSVEGRSLIAQGSKDGYLYIIDRRTHRVVSRTAVTTVSAGDAEPTTQGTLVCPGISGGFLYNSPSFDPRTEALISGTVDWCSTLYLDPTPPQYAPRQEFAGGRQEHVGTGSGWVTSISAATGKVLWRFQTAAPVFAAVTTTAGGVTFTGDHDGRLYAFRSADGALLWKHETGGSIAGGVITYQIGSRQYLAVTSGKGALSPAAAAGPPTVFIFGLAGHNPSSAPTASRAAEPVPLSRRTAQRRFTITSILPLGPTSHDPTMLTRLTMSAVQKAAPNESTCMPGSIHATRATMPALMTIRKKPRVMMVMGRVSTMAMGLTMELTTPSSTPARIKVSGLSMLIP